MPEYPMTAERHKSVFGWASLSERIRVATEELAAARRDGASEYTLQTISDWVMRLNERLSRGGDNPNEWKGVTKEGK
jgi:hypothetical protein